MQKLVITQAKKTKERSWLSTVFNILLQQSVMDLGVTYKNFFDSLKGKRKGKKVGSPKFKKKINKQSAQFRIGGFSIKRENLELMVTIAHLKQYEALSDRLQFQHLQV